MGIPQQDNIGSTDKDELAEPPVYWPSWFDEPGCPRPEDLKGLLDSWLTITVTEEYTGKTYTWEVPRFAAWQIVEATRKLGIHQAMQLAYFAVRPLYDSDATRPGEPPWLFKARVEATLSTLLNEADREKWESAKDEIISLCYHALRERKITREGAARLASALLKQSMSIDAWRMRVDRWAKERNLPKVGQRQRVQKMVI